MLNLSKVQGHIVNSDIGGSMQILASAGTGKTRVLTERVRHILEHTKKDGVLVLTFTNKAAEEVKMRLGNCEQAEARAWATTIHSMALRILEKYGHTVGLPTELCIYDRDNDRNEIFMQSLREDGVNIDEYLNIPDDKELKSREEKLKRMMSLFAEIKRELLTESGVVEKHSSFLWKKFQDYQDTLLNSGGIDYEDILVYAHKILLTHDWVARVYRARFKHICVDEAQDLNKAQYEFIKALCGDDIRSVLMVGDPNQMIYGFNGSSIEYLCTHFISDFSPQQSMLKGNYRSSKAVITAANKLKPKSQMETDYALEGHMRIFEFLTEKDEANHIVLTVKKLLNLKKHADIEGEISLNKMVVIARNRFVFKKLEEALNLEGIPYSLRKGERQLEPLTRFCKVLDYAMRVKLNPKDWIAGKKLCQELGLAEPDACLVTVLEKLAKQVSELNDEDSGLLGRLLCAVDKLDVENPKIPKFKKELEDYLKSLAETQPKMLSDKYEEIKLSLEELDEFSSTWTRFKRKGLGDSLLAFRNALALGQLTEDGTDNGLTLSTVHTMKGLEKDIVFLIGMCEGVFPDYRARCNEALEEERNNAFVAVTRAKRWLYISYPKQREMPWGQSKPQSKSRFISEIES